MVSKKKITTELLHIALVITLLRGNPRQIGIYDNIISSNFFNDVDNLVNIDNILVEGPNWASSRTNYHRLGMYLDPGIEQAKSFYGNFDSYNDDYNYSGSLDYENNLDEEIYRQQSRLLLLSHLNAAYVRKDPIQTFRDITAYLVSDTTTESLPNSLAGLPSAPPASTSGSSNGQTGNISPSPSTDSGHDSESGDESGRNSFSEESDLSEAKSDGPLFEVVEDLLVHQHDRTQTFSGIQEVPVMGPDVEAGPSTHHDSYSYLDRLSSDLNTDNNIDATEFLDFIINNHNDSEELGGAASLPLSEPHSFHLSGDLGNHLLLDQSMVADLFDLQQIQPSSNSQQDESEMEWTLAEEEAHLDFYKNFNDAANEVMRTAPLREIEGRLSPEHGATGIEDEKISQAASADVTDITLEEVIDDWLETDSGVFDFLESPTALSEGRTTFDFDSIPSLDSVESIPIEVDFDGNQGSSPSPRRADDEKNGTTVDMIQAAPTIHTNNGRPTPHLTQSRGFQVHARMPGLLRGGNSMDQRWQDVVNFLNLQQGGGPHDGSGGSLPPSLSHPFGSHLHHHGPPLHHHHHHHHFSAPPPTAPYNTDSARSVLLQNATLPPPDVTSPYTSLNMGPPPNIGSAVASSMHLTNSSDPMIDPNVHYKMIEQSHDMIYYPNATNHAEINNQSTTDGLFSQEDELQFVEMSALNEGFVHLRMLDYSGGATISNSLEGAASLPHGPQQSLPNGCSSIAMTAAEDRLEASSDSAVSSMSMGSERVPPMTDPSDNEWVDPDHPHSSHDSSPYSLDYPGVKGRGYEYYGKDRVPVAQKKHHMFGKRFQQEQGPYVLPPHHHPLPYPSGSGLHSSPILDSMDLKYGCGVEFARHQNDLRANGGLGLDSVHNNHTYALPPTQAENQLTTFKAPKPPVKDKQPKKDSLSRDDKRARNMNLPITTEDIINLPMDEFNERLSKFDLSEPQLSLIRDIRRRGKNKVAAQNCRKRKLDQIMQLADEVQRIRERKHSLLREQQELSVRRHDLKERYQLLYRHVFQALRDPDGNPYSIYEYNLQQAADGNIMLVPRVPTHPPTSADNIPSSRRDKSKDDQGQGRK